MDTRQLGVLGEELARHFLKNRGYKILLQNYECTFGEIDLIAKENGELVFVEVKTRRSEAMGLPQESVTHHKRHQIVKSAKCYLERYRIGDTPCRFDVVSILMMPGETPAIEVIRDAFGLDG